MKNRTSRAQCKLACDCRGAADFAQATASEKHDFVIILIDNHVKLPFILWNSDKAVTDRAFCFLVLVT